MFSEKGRSQVERNCVGCGVVFEGESARCPACEVDVAPVESREPNLYATAGMWIGIASIFLSWVGAVPLAAIVLSAVGLSKSAQLDGKGKGQAVAGLVLGIVYMLVNLNTYGHLG